MCVYVQFHEFPPGAIVARDIYDPSHGMLLRAGSQIHPQDVRVLFRRGFHSVYIRDAYTSDLNPTQNITDVTRITAVDEVYRFHLQQSSIDTANGDITGLISVSEQMVDEVSSKTNLTLPAHDLRGYDDYTFRHSVNVTAIALVIGRAMNLTKTELSELALGGLLHDVGKTYVALSILNKRGKLDDFEFSQIRKHTVDGYKTLSERTRTSPRVWAMALQHHETLDGSGYPEGRKDRNIHPWARIIAVADIYDALRSDRPYKKGWDSGRAMKLLRELADEGKLDRKIVELFLEFSKPYPVGTVVRLKSSETAVVMEQDPRDSNNPVVRVITDSKGKYYTTNESRIVKLVDHPELGILMTVT